MPPLPPQQTTHTHMHADGAGLGVSGSDRQGSNPFGNSFSNGCNWLLEGTVPDIDFACIHTWADQWTESRDQDGWKK